MKQKSHYKYCKGNEWGKKARKQDPKGKQYHERQAKKEIADALDIKRRELHIDSEDIFAHRKELWQTET